MKKYKICLLLLLGLSLILSGCGGDKYLKTKSTNLSLANFFNTNYVTSVKEFDGIGKDDTIITVEADRINYSNYMQPLMSVLPEERCAISVVDYLSAINQKEGVLRIDSVTKTKIYEYKTVFKQELMSQANTSSLAENASNISAVVLVKSTPNKNDAEIGAWLFYKNSSEKYDVASLLNEQANANLTCVFTINKYVVQTNAYTLTYGKNGAKASSETTVTFNGAKGCLNYEIKTALTNNTSTINYTFKKNIYLYANSVVGVRSLISFKNNNKNANIIYEQMSKDFYKRLKLGDVKNEADILSMETMQEDNLAKENTSDSVGFKFVSDTQESEGNIISYIKYGGAE